MLPAQGEGLHPLRGQAHDGQAVKGQQAQIGAQDPALVRAPGPGAGKPRGKALIVGLGAAITHDRTHDDTSRLGTAPGPSLSFPSRRPAAVAAAPGGKQKNDEMATEGPLCDIIVVWMGILYPRSGLLSRAKSPKTGGAGDGNFGRPPIDKAGGSEYLFK